jgi:hypothetical protein
MSAYDELAGFRFTSGRDYDKRSVETFRARALNRVDELLNEITRLRDEVAALRADGAEAAPAPPMVRVDLGDSWLTAPATTLAFPPPAGTALETGDGRTGSAMSPSGPSGPSGASDAGVAHWVSSIENAVVADDDRATIGTVDLAPTPTWTDGDSGWDTTDVASSTDVGAGAANGWDDVPSTPAGDDTEASSYAHNGWGDAPSTGPNATITEPVADAPPGGSPSPLFAPIQLGEAMTSPASTAMLLGLSGAADTAADTEDATDTEVPVAPVTHHEPAAAVVAPVETITIDDRRPLDVHARNGHSSKSEVAPTTDEPAHDVADTESHTDTETPIEAVDPGQLLPAGVTDVEVVEVGDEPANSPIVIEASPDEIGALPTPVRHWSGWLKK